MKRKLWVMLPVLLALLQIPTPGVQAQQPGTSLHLQLTLSRKPSTAQPSPDPQMAEKDAEQAIAEVQARQRRDELARELVPGPVRRPDLAPDVIGGIQSRNINDALRRR